MKLDWWREAKILAVVAAVTAVLFAPLLFRPVSTCAVGGQDLRFRAEVPAALAARRLDATAMRVGLGSAAVDGWDSLGEALVADGELYLRSTRRGRDYYRTLRARYFQSNAFVYVPRDVAPSATRRVVPGTRLADLLRELAGQHPGGVLVAGHVRAAPLEMIAIARPAIAGRPILAHTAEYYTRPLASAPDAWAYVVALALRADHPQAARLLPPAAAGSRDGFGIALRLAAAPSAPVSAPAPGSVVAVGQLVADSVLAEGTLEVYPVTRLEDCAPAK